MVQMCHRTGSRGESFFFFRIIKAPARLYYTIQVAQWLRVGQVKCESEHFVHIVSDVG